ncbi:HD-GYP domain-containing protein [Bacillus luteolus]|uniref:HD-GYP domain-containing protein n=1 Tax=Litchfieldia luteola TaxID=682179 RepID=A0ABR9QEX9_9BACI|nr:HD-GYP domain-containing protein [Cytobacillus luteolus]MBE4907043.1 HD-GYP domain-containing protein [Cytobacillus luteolus]MBP1943490.1 putative nucleotidyltransferase with HDIG domain [Cytobacillus luteolus]
MKTKSMQVSFELVGETLSDDIYSDHGILLLKKGTVLNETHILQLKNYQNRAFINVEEDNSSEPSPLQSFQELYSENLKKMKAIFNDHHPDLLPPMQQIFEDFVPLFEKSIENTKFINQINESMSFDEYTYRHCLNVGITAAIIGKLLGLRKKELTKLGQMGLLHDIGKMTVPPDLLNKPDKLSKAEWAQVSQHTTKGFEMLKKATNVDLNVIVAALLHHERLDGSGYPNGLKQKDIPFLVQIVSVADTFDAICSERSYQPKKSVFAAINELMKEANSNKLNPAIVVPFVRYLMRQYIREEVKLSNGEIAEIVFIHENEPHQPLVRISEEYMDLRKASKLEIVDHGNKVEVIGAP